MVVLKCKTLLKHLKQGNTTVKETVSFVIGRSKVHGKR